MGYTTHRDPEIERLLSALNEWEQQHGTTNSPDRMLKSSGEANARIVELRKQLATIGAVYHWDGKAYVLDSVMPEANKP